MVVNRFGAPNDVRNFVHRRIIGAATGFLTGGITGAIGGAVRGGRSGGQPAFTASDRPVASARGLTARGRTRCLPGQIRINNGLCVDPMAALPGGRPFLSGATSAIRASGFMDAGGARFGGNGGAYAPQIDDVIVRRCFPGDVLGKDGFCYPKSSIKNSEREHPKGRRPLGTPGELKALAKAASFGRRMEETVKRMQKIGVLKKPSRGRSRAPRPKLIGPGPGTVTVIDTE